MRPTRDCSHYISIKQTLTIETQPAVKGASLKPHENRSVTLVTSHSCHIITRVDDVTEVRS
jgi:hypothetical protein